MTVTTNPNYLQATGFKIVIDRARYGNVEMFAQNVSHPSVSSGAASRPASRANLHYPADKLTFGQFQATLIADEGLEGYQELYAWMLRLVNQNHKTRLFADSDEFPSMLDITLLVLNSHNNVTLKIRYIDCVITDLGDINFQSTDDNTTFITFPASFSFTRFEIV